MHPFDVVTITASLPEHGIVPGTQGTLVDVLDDYTMLVEVSDPNGRTLALVPVPREALQLATPSS